MTNEQVNLSPAALDAIREAQKEAIKEWLDDMWAAVGKWTVKGILALAFAGFMYLLIVTHGFGTVSTPTSLIGK